MPEPGVADEPSDWDAIVATLPAANRTRASAYPLDPDRVRGAWMGRAVACVLGKPVEKIPRRGIEEILRATDRWPLDRYFTAVGLDPAVSERWPWNRRQPADQPRGEPRRHAGGRRPQLHPGRAARPRAARRRRSPRTTWPRCGSSTSRPGGPSRRSGWPTATSWRGSRRRGPRGSATRSASGSGPRSAPTSTAGPTPETRCGRPSGPGATPPSATPATGCTAPCSSPRWPPRPSAEATSVRFSTWAPASFRPTAGWPVPSRLGASSVGAAATHQAYAELEAEFVASLAVQPQHTALVAYAWRPGAGIRPVDLLAVMGGWDTDSNAPSA